MKRWICVLVCACTHSLVMAANPEKETRLKKGAIIYAFTEVAWTRGNSYIRNLPTDLLTCDSAGCRYVVPACESLYVASQIKDRTWVLPGDEQVRKWMNPYSMKNIFLSPGTENVDSMGVSISGGWSTGEGFERNWSLSRDECFAKIGKQPQPTPSASPTPSSSPTPAPSPSASPTPTP